MRAFKCIDIIRYLTLSSQDKMLIGLGLKPDLLWLHRQRNSWLVAGGRPDGRVQRDSEWRTRKEPCSMLSPSFLSWDPNAYKEERDKTNERTEYQFRFPVMPYNATVWPFSYVILCNHDRSISKWMTYTSESRSFNIIQIEIRFVILKRHFLLSC